MKAVDEVGRNQNKAKTIIFNANDVKNIYQKSNSLRHNANME